MNPLARVHEHFHDYIEREIRRDTMQNSDLIENISIQRETILYPRMKLFLQVTQGRIDQIYILLDKL